MSTVEQLEAQLKNAEYHLHAATGMAGKTNARSDAATPGGLTDYDPAIRSGIRRKPSRKADNRRFNAYAREAEAQRNLTERLEKVDRLRRALDVAIRDRDRVRFTHEDLTGARAVRDQFGWHRVARINAKSVSIETGYSWVDRIPFDTILEVHA